MQMPELVGEGGFSPVHFQVALDRVIYDTARQAFGGKALELPAGAAAAKLRYLGDGTAVIDYLDGAGKESQGTEQHGSPSGL